MHLPRLRIFHSNVLINERATLHLVAMSRLTSLIIRIPELRNVHFSDYRFLGCMESLDTINLYAPDVESCTLLLTALHAPNLHTLDLQFSASCSSSALHQLFEIIRPFRFLKCLRLWADRVSLGFFSHSSCKISARTISLLYALQDLQDLRIEEHVAADLRDDDALQMAKAWPKMCKLTFTALAGSERPGGRPLLTARALTYFAKYCAQLHQIGLAFDVSLIEPKLMENVKEEDIGEDLAVLEVYSPFSEVQHPAEVAQFLFRLFPNLQSVRFGDIDLAISHGWLRVSSCFRSLTCSM
jgi:hypothetical protein